MKTKHFALALVATVASTLSGLAATGAFQEGFAAAQPTDQHRWMKKQVGTWDTTLQSMGSESKGTWVVTSIHGGLWNQGSYQGEMMGSPFTGSELFGYDPGKGAFISVWVDSLSAKMGLLEGHYDAASKKLVMKGETEGMDGQPTVTTNVTDFVDDDTMVFTMTMPGPDGADLEVMTIAYKRRK
jgi:hypothetical protein